MRAFILRSCYSVHNEVQPWPTVLTAVPRYVPSGRSAPTARSICGADAGPRGGYVHPTTPVPVAPAAVAAAPAAAPAAAAPVAAAAAPAEAAAAAVCPHCGAALPSPDTQYCPQCGDPVSEMSPVARMRRLLSNRYLVGALAVVFVLLLAGIVLAGQGDSGATGASAQAVNVGALRLRR